MDFYDAKLESLEALKEEELYLYEEDSDWEPEDIEPLDFSHYEEEN